MTERSDIIGADELYLANGSIQRSGLIYTRQCGWVDLGHARPDGPQVLWDDIRHNTTPNASLQDPDVGIIYLQKMKTYGVTETVARKYKVRKQLTPAEQKSIALAIFMDVSVAFEARQANWLHRQISDSGFSAEDLVSNLIGFYRAINPGIEYVMACEPVSKEQAYAIWDQFGVVGANKNYQFKPRLYPNALLKCGVPNFCRLPLKLNTIIPATMGIKFRREQ